MIMNMPLCSKCKKNVAVVFVTRLENGKAVNEGLCLQCAKELNIKPVTDMIERFGITDSDIENVAQELQNANPEEMISALMRGVADDLNDLEEDDEEDEEVEPVRGRRRQQEEDDRESGRPSRRNARETAQTSRRGVQSADTASRRPVRGAEARSGQGEEQRRPAAQRKAKNFLLDDDDFEFEFLNMDDKDL